MSSSATSLNPANGEVIRRYDRHSGGDIDRILERARRLSAEWAAMDVADRAARLGSLAGRVRERAEGLAELVSTEMGKPLAQAKSEVEKCAWVCDYYAEYAHAFLEPLPVETDARRSHVVFRPLGPVLAVMPWNFPLWQVFRFAAPALAAGNVGVLRHASNVTGCALAIEQLFEESAMPLGVVVAGKDDVRRIIEDERIAAVTLTGSVSAGRSVASAAGGAIKKTVLELGGSDAYVVLADADLDLAVERCVTSRLINSGQSCIAAKRFIVEAAVHERFVEAFVEAMRAKRAADPFDAGADLGPMAQERTRAKLHEQVESSVAAGATLALGGEMPEGPGFFYPPTVLTGVEPGMPAFDTEVFGPAAAITRARDAEDAIGLANRTCYGLGAAVFTRDVERGEAIAAQRLEAGSCFVNDFVRSDPRLPFGGVKDSGYGRELGLFGIKEFVNAKTTYVG